MRMKSNRRIFLKFLDNNLIRILGDVGRLLENDIKKSMVGKSPPSSAPGEPPHVRTGTLRRSITHDVDESKHLVRIGTGLKYGKHLELGTSKMRARPFIRPAVLRNTGEIKAKFRVR